MIGPFAASGTQFAGIVEYLDGAESAGLTHAELEDRLRADGFELLRLLFQDHLDLRASREQRVEAVMDADGTRRGWVEADHDRPLVTLFGEVRVCRLAYRAKGAANLYPADGVLNLPAESFSHGLRALAAVETARGSFEEAVAAIDRATAVHVGKRQVEGFAQEAAVDFDAFFARDRAGGQDPDADHDDDVLVISVDGKGIVMRPEALRPATAAKAAGATTKLKGRLSKGEKANRKRMAEVGAVYSVRPVPRSPTDVMAHRGDGPPKQAPDATDKWLTASVVDSAATVIADVFDEATRRDPQHQRTWVALVDGNNHQINRINKEATSRDINITILVDWVHVLEYLWSAAWSFFGEGDPAAEDWVHDKALAVLNGQASIVAAAIRRKATTLGLDTTTRKNADTCADYLLAKSGYLDYPTALAAGWPIATGVIEGACRHLVKDRMDITGARWGLNGAEAVLKLRALRANNCWDDYWAFHLDREHQRVHQARYHNSTIPHAA
ncbi:MAG: ISKra4 family transposase [Actinobacteria bacterium]|nr:ISKra4 family transposase [Actinomycetota bacterium]